MWPLPRELLWAVIVALGITVVAVWPSHQQLVRQAPNINAQQQSEHAVSRDNTTEQTPSASVDDRGRPQDQYGGENASEVTILGIRPGEWLLGIVTWMLWFATVRLVQGADNNAERELRAYVQVIMDEKSIVQIVEGKKATFPLFLKNSGSTPAHDVMLKIDILPVDWPLKNPLPEIKWEAFDALKGSRTVLNPQQQMAADATGEEPISAAEIERFRKEDARRVCIYGEVNYRDVFKKPHVTKFRLISGWEGGRPAQFKWCYDGNEAD